MVFIYINSLAFLVLSAIHWYWMFGGKRGLSVSLPTLNNTKKLDPTPLMTFFVAFGLLLFAIITFGNSGIFNKFIGSQIFVIGNLVIAGIFFMRAIGDFKYVGLFKKVKETEFGIYDKKYFTPLCLFITLNCILIALTV